MSAFVVSKAHIDAMIDAGLAAMPRNYGPVRWHTKDLRGLTFQEVQQAHRQLTQETANVVGQMLIDECVKSVMYRYEDSDLTKLPGPLNSYWLIPYQYQPGRMPTPVEAVEALKLISCYEYQSCEHPDWPETEAYRFCDSLRRAMINLLPGYEEAPWGEDRSEAKP